MSEQKQEFVFQTEVQKVLDILIYSLYTHKEIFLRELISNAADALDKLNYLLLTDAKEQIIDNDLPLEIQLSFDEKKNILTIADTGIGMTEAELQKNLGTIAHSGSSAFLQEVAKGGEKPLDLIGQFGVGFYSVFMVAKEVRVYSKSYTGQDAHVWISSGKGGFTVESTEFQKKRGTSIEIYLKDDEKEFLEKYRLESVINKYSNFVNFPIFIQGEQVNKIAALWTRNKNEITQEQYTEFYKFIARAGTEFFTHLHLKFDTPLQFSSILFIPKENMEKLGFMKYEQGLHLYCKRVLIQIDNKDLLPPYLRFIYGVVDSEDLNLNVSREMIQNDPIYQKIKSNLTKKALDQLAEIAKTDAVKYAEFFDSFGRFLKEGLHLDFSHREKLVELLRFHSSKGEQLESWVSLEDYLQRMDSDQKEIYYLTGSDLKSITRSPYLEMFKKANIEVLFLDDPLDEFVLDMLMNYKEKKFKSVEQADLDFLKETAKREHNEENELTDEEKKEVDNLLNFIKLTLKDDVVDVVDSIRLVGSPACLVNADQSHSSHVQKLLKMMNPETAQSKKILEVNRQSPIMLNLARLYAKDPALPLLKELVFQIYQNAQISADGIVEQPDNLIKRMERIMRETVDLLLNTK